MVAAVAGSRDRPFVRARPERGGDAPGSAAGGGPEAEGGGGSGGDGPFPEVARSGGAVAEPAEKEKRSSCPSPFRFRPARGPLLEATAAFVTFAFAFAFAFVFLRNLAYFPRGWFGSSPIV
jgi:hypothetical protein